MGSVASLGAMAPSPYSPRHAAAEADFRKVLEEATLEQPDEVSYGFDPDEVIFRWYQTKVVVLLELEQESTQARFGLPAVG